MKRARESREGCAEAVLNRAVASEDLAPLLERFARTRSPDALNQLIGALGPRLLPYIRAHIDRHLARRVDPMDVFQEVCLGLYRMREDYRDLGIRAAWAFLYRVTRNELAAVGRFHAAQRRNVRREESSPSSEKLVHEENLLGRGNRGQPTTPSRAAWRAERAAILARCVDRLPSRDRDLIRLLDYESLGNAEVARRLGLSVAQVRLRHHRALKKLRILVAGEISGPE